MTKAAHGPATREQAATSAETRQEEGKTKMLSIRIDVDIVQLAVAAAVLLNS